jgi:hypothetical protein
MHLRGLGVLELRQRQNRLLELCREDIGDRIPAGLDERWEVLEAQNALTCLH